MLIISIPKSASTSLLDTFGKLHALPSRQLDFKNRSSDADFPLLGNLHNDTCKLRNEDFSVFKDQHMLYKQHILPTEEHVKVLKNIKKVVLLRNPYDILLSYRRATVKGIHPEKNGMHSSLSEGEWIEKAESNGFFDEIKNFHQGWMQQQDENTLILRYKELVNNPHQSINKIEAFFDLPITKRKIVLSKKRYSHHSKLIDSLNNVRRDLMRFITKNNIYEPLKNFQTYLRNHGIKWI